MGEHDVTEKVLGLYAAMIAAKKRADEIQREWLRRKNALDAAASRISGPSYTDEDARAFVDAWRSYENRAHLDWSVRDTTKAFDNAWYGMCAIDRIFAYSAGRERFGDKFCDYVCALDDRRFGGGSED
jgi:hypothetical protein